MDDWRITWHGIFGQPPSRPSSREESAQVVLAGLLFGVSPANFLRYPPTPEGVRFLAEVWSAAFGAGPGLHVSWAVNEYRMPVPPDLRGEIPFTYRCPDLACGVGEDRVVIVELKTEPNSYDPGQITDYLRLAHRMHPEAHVDVILLATHRPGGSPTRSHNQRYAELTWAEVAPMFGTSFEGTRRRPPGHFHRPVADGRGAHPGRSRTTRGEHHPWGGDNRGPDRYLDRPGAEHRPRPRGRGSEPGRTARHQRCVRLRR